MTRSCCQSFLPLVSFVCYFVTKVVVVALLLAVLGSATAELTVALSLIVPTV